MRSAHNSRLRTHARLQVTPRLCLGFSRSNKAGAKLECTSPVRRERVRGQDSLCGTVSHLSSFALLLQTNTNARCAENDEGYYWATIALFAAVFLLCVVIVVLHFTSRR